MKYARIKEHLQKLIVKKKKTIFVCICAFVCFILIISLVNAPIMRENRKLIEPFVGIWVEDDPYLAGVYNINNRYASDSILMDDNTWYQISKYKLKVSEGIVYLADDEGIQFRLDVIDDNTIKVTGVSSDFQHCDPSTYFRIDENHPMPTMPQNDTSHIQVWETDSNTSSGSSSDSLKEGEYWCMGKNDTCKNKTYDPYDYYCDSCDPDGDNVEG